MNAPDRFELFLLGPGEKKVTEEPDTRMPNTSIFTFNKEDHTLGNLLRAHLLKHPHVVYSGYKMGHPLVSSFELRIQTDGTINPRQAVVQTCKELVGNLGELSRHFTREMELYRIANQNGAAQGNGVGGGPAGAGAGADGNVGGV
ncbi:MAG: DNA-directed RNA polymerase II core subunit [Peltula sp. TS41687]|nr:MAG: DNA-directed RNA polymerase II core subunit [Peltula sp. TS41687]